MQKLKLFLFLLTLLFSAKSMQAQISIGPKGGVNIASYGIEGFGSNDFKPNLGIQMGLISQFKINERIAIQSELLYFQKGMKVNTEILGQPFQSKETLNYFEIPVLAKINFNTNGGPSYFATIGPSFGIGINLKAVVDGQVIKYNFNETNLNRLDLGLSIGTGAQFNVGPGALIIELRYLQGLNSINSGTNYSKTRNRGIGISTGFLLPLGG